MWLLDVPKLASNIECTYRLRGTHTVCGCRPHHSASLPQRGEVSSSTSSNKDGGTPISKVSAQVVSN
jgi:hypothetical protein